MFLSTFANLRDLMTYIQVKEEEGGEAPQFHDRALCMQCVMLNVGYHLQGKYSKKGEHLGKPLDRFGIAYTSNLCKKKGRWKVLFTAGC